MWTKRGRLISSKSCFLPGSNSKGPIRCDCNHFRLLTVRKGMIATNHYNLILILEICNKSIPINADAHEESVQCHPRLPYFHVVF